MRRKAVPIFLHPSLVCPEDRESFMEIVFTLYFARDIPSAQTHLLKLVGRDGKIRLFLLRVHHYKRADDSGEMEEEFVLYIEKAPPSRHITSMPSSCYPVIQTFRQVTFQERLVGGGIGDDGAAAAAAGDGNEGPVSASASASASALASATQSAAAIDGMIPLAYLPMPSSLGCPSPMDEVARWGKEERMLQEKAAGIFNLPAERLRRPLESNSVPSSLSLLPPPRSPLELMATANEEVDALLDIGIVVDAGDEEGSKDWSLWEGEEQGEGDEEGGNDEACYFNCMLTVPVLGAGVLPHIFEDGERGDSER